MALARTARMHWAGTYDQALDYAAGAVVRQGGGLYCARLLRPHGAVAPADDAASWDTLASAPAGVPVLYGPYVVDYTDIPHDGNRRTLWTPAVGDTLLRLFCDSQGSTLFDSGQLYVGQNVDGTVLPSLNCIAFCGHSGDPNFLLSAFDLVGTATALNATDSAGLNWSPIAYVFHTADPVQIQLAQTGGTDPGAGHVELYALVCRAVAP